MSAHEPPPWAPNQVPFPSPEQQQKYHDELVALITRAHADGMEVAGWISEALEAVARKLPGRVEGLLRQRPGSWEAADIRHLAGGAEIFPDDDDDDWGAEWDDDELGSALDAEGPRSCGNCHTYPCSCAELAEQGMLCSRCGRVHCDCDGAP